MRSTSSGGRALGDSLVVKERVQLRHLGHGQLGFQLPSRRSHDVDVLSDLVAGELDREVVKVDVEIYADGTIEAELLAE